MNNQAAQTMPDSMKIAERAQEILGETPDRERIAIRLAQLEFAALSQTAGVADGMVLVPVIPTKEMIARGDEIIAEDGKRVRPESIYDAMVSAAPAASGGDNCEDCQIHRQAHHEIDAVVMGAGAFEVLHEGGVEPAWKNTIEAVKKLANPPAAASVSERDDDDTMVEMVARAIAVNGVGREWDDFKPNNAHDLDQSDLREYAKAAIAALEQALTQQRGSVSYNADLAMHWIERYAAGIDEECKLDRIAEAFTTTPQPSADAVREDSDRLDWIESQISKYGDGYTEPREAGFIIEWQQERPDHRWPGLRAWIDEERRRTSADELESLLGRGG